MIRLIVVDVDGCLTAGEGQPLDFQALARIARTNMRARADPRTPSVTLCTAWPAEATGIPLHEMAGIGDAEGDLPLLGAVRFAGAPANCAPAVRARADRVARQSFARGVIELIGFIERRNRKGDPHCE